MARKKKTEIRMDIKSKLMLIGFTVVTTGGIIALYAFHHIGG